MRYNIFNKIHQPLRLTLLNTCIYLAESQGFNVTAVAVTIKKVTEVLKVFKAQLKYEGLYLLPLVFEYEPSVWDAYTREHHKAMNMATNLNELLKSYSAIKDENEQSEWARQVSAAFNEFTLFNYHHMDDEEEVLSEFLLRYYKDDTILQIQEEMEMPGTLIKQHESKEVYEVAA